MFKTLSGTLLGAGLLLGAVQAEGRDYSGALKVSTLGLGVEVATEVCSKTNFRLGFNNYSKDETTTESGVNYNADLTLMTFSGLFDYHPWDGIFRVSGGLMYNGNEIDLKGNLAGVGTTAVEIGGTTYNFTAADSINASLDFRKVAPYVGIGWGNSLAENKKWGFLFDIGAVFQGDPDVDYNVNVNTPGISTATLAADIAAEKKQLEDDISGVPAVYPLVSLGVSYKF